MSNPRYAKVVQLDDARRPTITTRELLRILAHAKEYMDRDPHRYPPVEKLDETEVLTWQRFVAAGGRRSIFGWPL